MQRFELDRDDRIDEYCPDGTFVTAEEAIAECAKRDAEIAKLKEALAEARGLIEECIESDNEFETEWDKAAKTFLAHSL